MSTYTVEQIQAVRAMYPSMTEADIITSLDKAEASKAKKRNKGGAIKGASPVVGAVAQGAGAVAQGTTPTPVLISQSAFAIRAVRKLRKPPFAGIHSVYSGFNRAFGQYFKLDKVAVIEAVGKLVVAKVIDGRPCKGGWMLYESGKAPASTHHDALSDILAD
jgi:hypothetical protein